MRGTVEQCAASQHHHQLRARLAVKSELPPQFPTVDVCVCVYFTLHCVCVLYFMMESTHTPSLKAVSPDLCKSAPVSGVADIAFADIVRPEIPIKLMTTQIKMITPYALWWRACKKETIFPANEPVNRGGGGVSFFRLLDAAERKSQCCT